ncbi:hypothetical protein [Arthrobacter rhizosphaerae]|uniref:hypothetical protein n=1 Tax=Arthrobacter rhizosphaerae TaxID=2855490 RepID=UPI001FF4825D|nr:hypothetical protein [Arthrobacter rhizosphaerae]
MNVTMKAVLEVLEPDEPNYDKAASLGPDSLPHLRALVEGDDPMLAAKAAFAASLLEGDQGKDVVTAAAHSETASIRVAAAAAANNLPADSAAVILMDLVDDSDPGVRKVALSSVPSDAPRQLTAKLASRSGQAAGAGSAGIEEAPSGPEAGTGMPGEGQTKMPGEKPAAGLMPGEKAPSSDGDAQGTGLMPGERP